MFTIEKNTIINFSKLSDYNPIIIHFNGGSYGNFIYRMMHKHLGNLPQIHDDLLYNSNGNSHSIYDNAYFDDFYSNDYKKDLKCQFDIKSDYIVIKKHCFPKISYDKSPLAKIAKLNIVVTFNNKSDAIWSYIQNIIKIESLAPFDRFDKINPEWFTENHIDQLQNIIKIFDKMIVAVHKSWYMDLTNENTICIKLNEILDTQSFYNFLKTLSKILDVSLNEKDLIMNSHKNFIDKQKLLGSYYNNYNKAWDETNLVDLCLKRFLS